MTDPEPIQVSITRDQLMDFAGALAELWIAAFDTNVVQLHDEERLDRAQELVSLWNDVFRLREEYARAVARAAGQDESHD
jgi:hypothetical protein